MICGDNPDKDNPKPDDSAILQSTNLYAYCMNNPANYIDRTGNIALVDDAVLLICCLIITACAMIGAVNSTTPLTESIPFTIPDFDSRPAFPFERAISEPEVKVKTETETITIADARRRFESGETLIYRYGFDRDGVYSLVPTDSDIQYNNTHNCKFGLSFSKKFKPGSAVTTVERINKTGVLIARIDNERHVSIFPKFGTLEEWHNQGINSIWTQILLMNIVMVI